MSDRELLELAAKAAGIEGAYDWRISNAQEEVGIRPTNMRYDHLWNPLTDDGDAFRLAVKLEMGVSASNGYARASMLLPNGEIIGCHEPMGSDRSAATRRAITRAAAEIGKEMK